MKSKGGKNRSSENEQYQFIFDENPDGILILDSKGKVIGINKMALSVAGFDKKKILNKSLLSLPPLPLKSKAIVMKNFLQRMRGKPVPPYEIDIITKEKVTRRVRINAHIIRKEKGTKSIVMISDITEEKKRDEKVRHSEAMFSSLFQISSLMILITDKKHSIIKMNQASEKAFGKKTINTNIKGLFGEKWKEIKKKKPLKRGRIPVEADIKTKDGNRTFEVSTNIISDQKGKIENIAWILQDITDRKAKEKRDAKEFQQILAIFDNIKESIFIIDPESHEVKYNNKEAENLLGKIRGEKCYKAIRGKNKVCSNCPFKKIKGTNGDISLEREYYNQKINKWLRCVDRRIKWPSGENMYFEMAYDITEDKVMQTMLKESEKNWRMLAENSPGIIAILEPDLTIKFINKPIMGLKKEEAEGSSFLSYIDKEFHEDVRQKISQVFETGKPERFEYTYEEDKKKWSEAQISPLSISGMIESVTVFTTDITIRKQSEEALKKQNQELEQFNKFATGREMRMIELKKEIKRLKKE